MSRLWMCFLFLWGVGAGLLAQNDLTLNRERDRVEIPFEYINNFIVVNVTFNNLLPLKFIFDTGAENTILTQREISDLFAVNYQRRITLYGADLNTEMYAYLAVGVDLNIGGMVRARRQTILVMEEDYFEFEKVAGFKVHGILGADFLRRFVVHIDYRKRQLILQDPSTFTGPPNNEYHAVPTEFNRYKPYVYLPAQVRPDSDPYPLKLLMDTGA
ncbi:MAG: clan AA aspartic protease, partial [Lewinella sp.]|nr:clan AA aspartic protease [Lewinella sp.]